MTATPRAIRPAYTRRSERARRGAAARDRRCPRDALSPRMRGAKGGVHREPEATAAHRSIGWRRSATASRRCSRDRGRDPRAPPASRPVPSTPGAMGPAGGSCRRWRCSAARTSAEGWWRPSKATPSGTPSPSTRRHSNSPAAPFGAPDNVLAGRRRGRSGAASVRRCELPSARWTPRSSRPRRGDRSTRQSFPRRPQRPAVCSQTARAEDCARADHGPGRGRRTQGGHWHRATAARTERRRPCPAMYTACTRPPDEAIRPSLPPASSET